MKNIIQCLFTITVLVTSSNAYAGSTTITVLDGNSVSKTYDVTTDAAGTSGNFLAKSVICDATAGANCATVTASGQVSVLSAGTMTSLQGGSWTNSALEAGSWTVTSLQGGTWSVTASGTVSALQSGPWSTTVTNANANGQATMANSSPVALASNQSVADPCMFQVKTNVPVSVTTSASVQLVALSGSTKIYVCSLGLIGATATVFSITGGTGTACATSAVAIMGAATATNGMSLTTNGGLTLGNGGVTVASTAAGSELCIIGGTGISGNLTVVQQ